MDKRESYDPQNLHFHYNKEDRISRLSNELKYPMKESFLKKNRHLFIILIDIIVVSIVFSIVSPIIKNKSTQLENYKLQLTGYKYDNTILISLKVNALIEKSDTNGIKIKFIINENEYNKVVIGNLPKKKGEQKIFRTNIEYPDKIDSISSEVEINRKMIKIDGILKSE